MRRTITRNAAMVSAVAAFMLLGCAFATSEDGWIEYAQELNEQLERIDARYENVRKALSEEYSILVEQRDETGKNIVDSFKSLEDRAVGREMDRIELEASVAVLRQMNVLNARNFAELAKIHTVRESIEAARHREERDMAAMRIDAEKTRARMANGDFSGRRIADLHERKISALAVELGNRYSVTLAALREYEELISSRVKGQREYHAGYEALVKEMSRPGIPDAARIEFQERLKRWNERQGIQERLYRNNELFIREKLEFQRMRSHEFARLNENRLQVEDAWRMKDGTIRARLRSLERERTRDGISKERKRAVSNEMDRLFNVQEMERLYHENALAVISERENLILQAMDVRRLYLESRNAIRLEMARTPMTPESIQKFRDEIAGLEGERINSERIIRSRLASLDDRMPDTYRIAPRSVPGLVRTDEDGKREEMEKKLEREREAKEAIEGFADAVVETYRNMVKYASQ